MFCLFPFLSLSLSLSVYVCVLCASPFCVVIYSGNMPSGACNQLTNFLFSPLSKKKKQYSWDYPKFPTESGIDSHMATAMRRHHRSRLAHERKELDDLVVAKFIESLRVLFLFCINPLITKLPPFFYFCWVCVCVCVNVNELGATTAPSPRNPLKLTRTSSPPPFEHGRFSCAAVLLYFGNEAGQSGRGRGRVGWAGPNHFPTKKSLKKFKTK